MEEVEETSEGENELTDAEENEESELSE
jgi:hypothetical protein